jgi:hypothetical protein
MKDQRIKVFAGAVDSLVESLEAVVRVSRWSDKEAPPAALSDAASKVVDRLGVASRLVSTTFQGTPADTHRVGVFCSTMKRLDAAYVTFRRRITSSPAQLGDAASALELEISDATGSAQPTLQ